MLQSSAVATRLPAQDLQRAREFYAEKLGLEPAEERPGGLVYRSARGEFALFESAGAPPGTLTQMAWEDADLQAAVARPKAPGGGLQAYDPPAPPTVGRVTAE